MGIVGFMEPIGAGVSLLYFGGVAAMNISQETNFYQKMSIIKFFRLLFYHIYLHFMKVDDGNKALAKFTTWLIFTIVFGIIIYFSYTTFRLIISENANNQDSSVFYIMIYIVVGFFVGKIVFFKGFDNFDLFRDYHVRYYFYFFLIVGFALTLAFYSMHINQERISKQREIQKTFIEMEK